MSANKLLLIPKRKKGLGCCTRILRMTSNTLIKKEHSKLWQVKPHSKIKLCELIAHPHRKGRASWEMHNPQMAVKHIQ